MENPDADPVIQEFPVYLSKSLEGLLHVFSFPLRPSNRPYEAANVELQVTEVNPSSNSASDNANDPRVSGLVNPSGPSPQQQARTTRATSIFGTSFDGTNTALPSGGRHQNADQVVVGVRPKFTLQMSFDTSGATQESFAGRDPLLDTRNQKKYITTTGHVSSLAEDQPFGDLIQHTSTNPNEDLSNNNNGFGGQNNSNNNNMMMNNNSNNNRATAAASPDAYFYRLESTPAPQHASYACALFYRNAVHLTPITGIHQFFPKPLVDKNLELSLISENNNNNQQVGNTYVPRILPRSIAVAKAAERSRKIDWLSADHCDTVPVAERLMSQTATSFYQNQQQQQRRSTSADSSSRRSQSAGGGRGEDGGSTDTNNTSPTISNNAHQRANFPPLPPGAVEATRTAAQMGRSTSDPLRDEEEMMWGLQAFFPFIDSAPEHEQLNLGGSGGRGGAAGGFSYLQNALATGKSNIALKFANHAMGIDEQVSAVVTGSKMATCEDLQKHVSTPSTSSGSSSSSSSTTVPVVRLVQALRRLSVCVHGVWVALWDPTCGGDSAYVREFLLYCFAVESDKNNGASISAREIFDLCGLGVDNNNNNENVSHSQLRKTIRTILPILADLNPETKRWSLKNYQNGRHARDLINNASDEVRQEVTQQYNGWVKRKDLVMNNMRLLAAGEQPPKGQLALRSVFAAGISALRGQQLAGNSARGGVGSSAQNMREAMMNEELERCRRFVRNSFELYGVINKGLFRERILSMNRQRESLIFAVQKENLQSALREELMGFTDSTWVLKNPPDPATASLRPYYIKAILQKKVFTTREVEQLAFQFVIDDPNQKVVKDIAQLQKNTGSTSGDQQQQQQQADTTSNNNNNEDDASATANKSTTTTNSNKSNPITLTVEQHNMGVRLINEFASFHRSEKIWHIKSGIVQFLSIQ